MKNQISCQYSLRRHVWTKPISQCTCWGHHPFGSQRFACKIGHIVGHLVRGTYRTVTIFTPEKWHNCRDKQLSAPLTVHGCLTSPPHLPFVSLAARQLAARSLLGLGLPPLQRDLQENNHHSVVWETANEYVNLERRVALACQMPF